MTDEIFILIGISRIDDEYSIPRLHHVEMHHVQRGSLPTWKLPAWVIMQELTEIKQTHWSRSILGIVIMKQGSGFHEFGEFIVGHVAYAKYVPFLNPAGWHYCVNYATDQQKLLRNILKGDSSFDEALRNMM